MNRIFIGVVMLMMAALAAPAQARTYASIIVDEQSGTVLHAANPDRRIQPASLTKMMTLYLVFEALKAKKLSLDQELVVSQRAARRPPSKLRLRTGETISVGDAIGALITKSANDVATVVAEALAGSEEQFAQFMTLRARQLGMSRTTFQNASGLPDKDQLSTARDLARLVVALRRDFPGRFHLFSTKEFVYRGRTYRNHNKLLSRYKGTDGVKTGYVRASGYNVALSVERDDRRLVAVVIGGKTRSRRDRHAMVLLNRAYKAIRAGDNPPIETAAVAPWRAKPAEKTVKPVKFASITVQEIDDDANSSEWSIQVGAFERFAPAHLAAHRAVRLAPALNGARVTVVPFQSDNGRLFRAQLGGLSEDRAESACKTLEAKKMSCLIVPADDETAVGDR